MPRIRLLRMRRESSIATGRGVRPAEPSLGASLASARRPVSRCFPQDSESHHRSHGWRSAIGASFPGGALRTADRTAHAVRRPPRRHPGERVIGGAMLIGREDTPVPTVFGGRFQPHDHQSIRPLRTPCNLPLQVTQGRHCRHRAEARPGARGRRWGRRSSLRASAASRSPSTNRRRRRSGPRSRRLPGGSRAAWSSGAGTVMSIPAARRAMDAGATFLVSPHTD